jgi:hypothetical protein
VLGVPCVKITFATSSQASPMLADARVIPRRADFEGEAPNEPASRKVVVLVPNALSCRTPSPNLPNQNSFSVFEHRSCGSGRDARRLSTGRSALGGHYAGLNGLAQFGPNAALLRAYWAMADICSVELPPFRAERLSVQAGRCEKRAEISLSGPVGHHPPAVVAKGDFCAQRRPISGLSADGGGGSVAGRHCRGGRAHGGNVRKREAPA